MWRSCEEKCVLYDVWSLRDAVFSPILVGIHLLRRSSLVASLTLKPNWTKCSGGKMTLSLHYLCQSSSSSQSTRGLAIIINCCLQAFLKSLLQNLPSSFYETEQHCSNGNSKHISECSDKMQTFQLNWLEKSKLHILQWAKHLTFNKWLA